jgi:hypothetical protein
MGQNLDPSGLNYFNARYYDSVVGQFTSADQVQGPNRYAYVDGNPETLTDPTGQFGMCGITALPDGMCWAGRHHKTNGPPPPPTIPPGITAAQCRKVDCRGDDGRNGGSGGNLVDPPPSGDHLPDCKTQSCLDNLKNGGIKELIGGGLEFIVAMGAMTAACTGPWAGVLCDPAVQTLKTMAFDALHHLVDAFQLIWEGTQTLGQRPDALVIFMLDAVKLGIDIVQIWTSIQAIKAAFTAGSQLWSQTKTYFKFMTGLAKMVSKGSAILTVILNGISLAPILGEALGDQYIQDVEDFANAGWVLLNESPCQYNNDCSPGTS